LLAAGTLVCDCFYDEEFLLENATLTALATIGIILTEERRSLGELSIGIVGYGRIGKELTRMMMYLGASPAVFTSKRSVYLELCECGVRAQLGADAEALLPLDILINTAPAPVFGMEAARFPASLRVMDLASGVNFPSTIGAKKYPSLPAKFYPHSAGRAWFNSVKRCLVGGKSFISGV
jgi:dipicolinate synthase subunit A